MLPALNFYLQKEKKGGIGISRSPPFGDGLNLNITGGNVSPHRFSIALKLDEIPVRSVCAPFVSKDCDLLPFFQRSDDRIVCPGIGTDIQAASSYFACFLGCLLFGRLLLFQQAAEDIAIDGTAVSLACYTAPCSA